MVLTYCSNEGFKCYVDLCASVFSVFIDYRACDNPCVNLSLTCKWNQALSDTHSETLNTKSF